MLPLESVGFAKAGLYEFKSRKTSCASIEITVIMIVLKKTLLKLKTYIWVFQEMLYRKWKLNYFTKITLKLPETLSHGTNK